MPSLRRPSSFRTLFEPLECRRLMAVLTPTNLNQNAGGSLREAIDTATAGDTIDCRQLRGTIYIAWSIDIQKDVTLLGPGSDKLAVEMVNAGGRAFRVAGGLTTHISGLTVKAGDGRGNWPETAGGGMLVAGQLSTPGTLVMDDVVFANNQSNETGGGLEADFTDVTMTRCRFTNNFAVGSVDALGGAVHVVGGTVNATGCTFDNNSACATGTTVETSALGGAVSLMSAGDSVFTNCTFANNVATADVAAGVDGATATAMGGAINVAMNGSLTLLNDTFGLNAANGDGATSFGGGVSVLGFGTFDTSRLTTLTVTNTVIAGNTADVGVDAFGLNVAGDGVSRSLSYNVLGVADDSGIVGGVDHNRAGTAANPLDAKLDPLTDNGGVVPTMLPRAASPVLGVASADAVPRTDARDYPRSPAYDVGAVERQANYSPAITELPDASAAAMTTYVGNLAATDVDGNAIAFSLVSGPAWLTLSDKGDGTARLIGTPAVDDGGVASVVVRASDGTLNWDQTLSINVDVSPVSLSESGVLSVVGTDDADVIHVWQKAGTGGAVRVAVGDRIRNYDLASVKAINIYGRGGDDTIVANCVDLGSYVQAGYGDDTIVGSDNADTITAAQGDDSVLAMGGDDWLDGNSGRDTLDGGDGNDRMYGGNGRDILTGGSGNDVLYGEAGTNIYVVADRARDRVFGTAGAQDWVMAGDAKDLLYTGAVYL